MAPWKAKVRPVTSPGRPARAPRPVLIEALESTLDREPGSAIDLGCGAGIDTLALLDRGWSVLALDSDPQALRRLRAAVDPPGLRMQLRSFADMQLPSAQLIHAGFSLPFCSPSDLLGVWDRLVTAVDAGGLFAGQLFGDRDSCSDHDDMTFHTRTEVESLLTEFDVLARRQRRTHRPYGELSIRPIAATARCSKPARPQCRPYPPGPGG